MKKTLTFILAITIGFAGMAQGKSNGKGHAKKSDKHEKHADKKGTYDDNDRNDRGDRNDRRERDDDYRNRENNAGKYAKNIPAKVRAAFNNDFPNAQNVSWTKNSGYWTATFPNGIYRRSITYASNGQRVNNNRSTSRRSGNTQDGSVWNRILSRE